MLKRLMAFLAQLASMLTAANPRLHLLLELEMLTSGVTAKSRLWVALESFGNELSGIDLDSLKGRAIEQLEVLERIHKPAALRAFGSS
jgi:hypothetical protein